MDEPTNGYMRKPRPRKTKKMLHVLFHLRMKSSDTAWHNSRNQENVKGPEGNGVVGLGFEKETASYR